MSDRTCLLCSKMFSLDENPSGLVYDDKHFICENCREEHSQQDLENISKTIMKEPGCGMPIALWLIHEQNKDKTMMTIKR